MKNRFIVSLKYEDINVYCNIFCKHDKKNLWNCLLYKDIGNVRLTENYL
jgi:hypothetical protein